MKLKTGVIVTKMDDQYVAVTAGEAGKAFNGMIKMNGTAAFIAKLLQNDISEDGIVDAICAEYDVDAETARVNVRAVVEKLASAGLVDR